MDGVLVIDKPSGPTSHDIVAVARRALGERRIGHTGTLDPMATGALPLACGRATRLARFLASADKEYEAVIRFGLTTDTFDVTGRETSRTDAVPSLADVTRALAAFQGEYLQSPPPVSAKKIGGKRAYALARAGAAVEPAAAAVRVSRLEVLGLDGPLVRIRLTCSAGFYVRSLAHATGAQLGTGGCLASLRRTRSGCFGLEEAVRLEQLQVDPAGAAGRAVPMHRLLTEFPGVILTDEGAERTSHGRDLGTDHFLGSWPSAAPWVRMLTPEGTLVGLAVPTGAGSLHPSVVLI